MAVNCSMKDRKIVEIEFNNLHTVACQLNDISQNYLLKDPMIYNFLNSRVH